MVKRGQTATINPPAHPLSSINAHSSRVGTPQFVTTIDGLDIHFIHVRSKHPSALPMIITHGWPGSVSELLGIVGPLTDPTAAYGGRAEDAFDVVLPSLPGYGFSGEPTEVGWDPVAPRAPGRSS